MMNLKKLVAAVSFVTLGLSASAVMAQNTAPAAATGAAVQQQGQTEVSDTELRQFLSASIEIAKLRDEYTNRLSNAKDQAIAQNLQEEAQDRMLSAVEATGLNATSYNALAEHVQSSPELQQRLQSMQ